jgi:hypothetical protein
MQLWDANPKRFRQIKRPLFLPPLAEAPNCLANHSRSSANASSSSGSNSHGNQKPCPPSISSEVLRPTCIPNLCPAESNTYTLTRLLADIQHGIIDRPVEIELSAEDKPRPGGGISGGFTSNQWAVALYGVRLVGDVWPTDGDREIAS